MLACCLGETFIRTALNYDIATLHPSQAHLAEYFVLPKSHGTYLRHHQHESHLTHANLFYYSPVLDHTLYLPPHGQENQYQPIYH